MNKGMVIIGIIGLIMIVTSAILWATVDIQLTHCCPPPTPSEISQILSDNRTSLSLMTFLQFMSIAFISALTLYAINPNRYNQPTCTKCGTKNTGDSKYCKKCGMEMKS